LRSQVAIDARGGRGDGRVPEGPGLLLPHEEFDILAQRSLIALEGKDIVGSPVDDLAGDVALAAHRVDGDDGALDGQHVQQPGDGDDLVGLVGHLDLGEHEALARGEGRDHVNRRLGAFRAAQRLAIDRDDVGRGAGLRRDPGGKAALELLGIEAGQDVAQMIVRGRAVRKGPEPPQQFELPLAEPGNVGDRLGTGQHGEQAQQQHLVERVDHLAALARVRQTLEIAQENDRFVESATIPRTIPRTIFHRRPPQPNQKTPTDSALQRFVTLAFTRLPWKGPFISLSGALPRARLVSLASRRVGNMQA
jgi:hypothetical protein